ncbi:alpha-L-rhamnosidase-related protein [Altibacter sp. HG106]|uniref:alpha-L-rhamnosidase-related protein n=1 Tax=Altibacter sp. HG106 TaxID=3023937 RepID=UPI00235094E2|nr:glycogen debranching protein [Altibacter sp. HG106]MDC7993930.1 glycogen debranching protein [Altibacter sp. HG106]
MKVFNLPILLAFLGLLGCQDQKPSTNTSTLRTLLDGSPSIKGTQQYLSSPFVTAGNRVYMVGHQDGSFPDLGWHIKGEMGGIWNHPIKLMDGFEARMLTEKDTVALESAQQFTNYPFANSLKYAEHNGLDITRTHFVPDDVEGILIQYEFNNTEDVTKEFQFEFTGQTDLRPTWLGKRTEMIDAADSLQYIAALNAWQAKDASNPWFVIFGTERTPETHTHLPNTQTGKGASGVTTYKLSLPPKSSEVLTVTIAGSYQSSEAAISSFETLQQQWQSLFETKKQRYQDLAAQTKLTTPDTLLNKAFEWLKYNNDWLVRTVPEIGSGIGAGLPDYPWWFGVDSEYALQGYMVLGQTEAVYNTIAVIDSMSRVTNGNGRIIHEMSTNGAVFNPGNINETPQFASLIWQVFQWNGDLEFLRKYFPTIESGLDWLLAENDADGNLLPDGFGMMEIHGMDSEMIDVASYTQKAFADAAKMAVILEKPELAERYTDIAAQLKQKINTDFWSEAFQSYADFIGTDTQALQLIEDAMVRADSLNKPWAVAELQQTKQEIIAHPSATPRPFVVHHNWVVNTPMEVGIATPEQATKALQTAAKYTNPFGVFVTGIDRDENAASEEGSFQGGKVFTYTGAVMTLPTGVQAIANNQYGQPDQALGYVKNIIRSFSFALPGSIYEVSPDYGMFTQAWNAYGIAVPVVTQFFGIQPTAHQKEIMVQPQLPSTWKKVSLENVRVGNNKISLYFENNDDTKTWHLQQKKPIGTWRFNSAKKHIPFLRSNQETES